MQPNNETCNILVTCGTNLSHNINEIRVVHLYQFMNFLNASHSVNRSQGGDVKVAAAFCWSPVGDEER